MTKIRIGCILWPPSKLITERLNHLKEVAPGICKEGDAKPHRGYIMWLADDCHAAALPFVDCLVDTFDTKTDMVPARHLVAVMQIFIGAPVVCAGARQKLEVETIVCGGIKKRERKTGKDTDCLNRKSSFSAYQATAVSKSGTRMAE